MVILLGHLSSTFCCGDRGPFNRDSFFAIPTAQNVIGPRHPGCQAPGSGRPAIDRLLTRRTNVWRTEPQFLLRRVD